MRTAGPRRHRSIARGLGLALITTTVAVLAGPAGTFGSFAGASTTPPGRPSALTVDDRRAPVGVNPDAVAFAWHVGDGRAGARQTAYRVRVTRTALSSTPSSNVVWDSGTVVSSREAFVEYGGPKLSPDTKYTWTVQTRNDAGATSAYAAPQSFVTGLRDSDWKAQWVRPGPPVTSQSEDQYTYVRRQVTLPAASIARATVYISASTQYVLWVNGRRVDAGPSFAYPDEQYYQASDVTALLKPGAPAVIGVLHHWYASGQGRPDSPPGLIVELSIWHTDGTREIIGTDGTWLQRAGQWQRAALRNGDVNETVENIDGRLAPVGWLTPTYATAGWTPVAVLGPAGSAPFTHLIAAQTRIVTHLVQPIKVTTLPSGAVVADYGQVLAASPRIALTAGVAGRMLNINVGYLLDPDGSVSQTKGVQGTDLSYTYTERAGAQAFRAYGYLAFRYLEVANPGEPLSKAALAIVAHHSGVPSEQSAFFSSSNPTLNDVYNVAAHSALNVAQEQFVDTPTREKGQFLLDSYDDSQATMRAFGEQNLTYQALRDFARSQARYWAQDGRLNVVYPNGDGARDIPDNTEHYPDWVWQYYLMTGDTAALHDFAPVVKGVTGYIARAIDPKTGLVTKLPGGGSDYLYGAVDWPPAGRFGYDMATVARTTENELAVQAFEQAARIDRAVGDTAAAQTETTRAVKLTQAINTKLMRNGVYIDGLEANGARSTHASQHANAFALAIGIVPKAAVTKVGAQVASLGISMGPDNGITLLRGLHAAGLDADVVKVLTDTKDPGWAQNIAAGGTFTWETWVPQDSDQDSMSHGWGSAALAAYEEVMLGVQRDGPTALTVSQPQTGLALANGTVTTVAGNVGVTWTLTQGKATLHLVVPANVTVTVKMGSKTTNVGAGRHVVTN
jgi:alpha-L-rhamnosidase